MPAWKRICCAVDASEPSRAALQYAVELVRDAGGALHVVHVLPAMRVTSAPFAPPPPPSSPSAGSLRDVTACIAEARALLPGLTVAIERCADVAEGIVAYAREWECDVIVVGTHRRRGLPRLVLGSVAAKVAREARCPVLVVPSESGSASRRAAHTDPEPARGLAADDDPARAPGGHRDARASPRPDGRERGAGA